MFSKVLDPAPGRCPCVGDGQLGLSADITFDRCIYADAHSTMSVPTTCSEFSICPSWPSRSQWQRWMGIDVEDSMQLASCCLAFLCFASLVQHCNCCKSFVRCVESDAAAYADVDSTQPGAICQGRFISRLANEGRKKGRKCSIVK